MTKRELTYEECYYYQTPISITLLPGVIALIAGSIFGYLNHVPLVSHVSFALFLLSFVVGGLWCAARYRSLR